MQIRDIVYGLGDFIEWTFGILTIAGNIPNILFIVIGFIFFFYWMGQMNKHKKQGGPV